MEVVAVGEEEHCGDGEKGVVANEVVGDSTADVAIVVVAWQPVVAAVVVADGSASSVVRTAERSIVTAVVQVA